MSPVAKIETQPFFTLTIMHKNTGAGKMFEKAKLKFSVLKFDLNEMDCMSNAMGLYK